MLFVSAGNNESVRFGYKEYPQTHNGPRRMHTKRFHR